MEFSEKTYINKVALIGHTIIDTILVLAYAVELARGSRTPGYFAVFAILCIAPVAAEILIYQKNPESGLLKHVIGTSYGILYLFVIFTSTANLAYTYAFPMFMLCVLYMDVSFSTRIFIGGFGGNVIYAIIHMMTVGYADSELPDLEIRIASVFLTGVFMVLACKAVKKVNEAKMHQIQDQTAESGKLAENVLSTSRTMMKEIGEISGSMESMETSVEKMHKSMTEVSDGTTQAATSAQKQLERTEQIQDYISKVKETAELIKQSMEESSEKIAEGQGRMETLADQADKSMAANKQVLDQMKSLAEYTGQMNTIIDTITSIANSTVMLALNASIEAARAGEAGRGFAVVATQISDLASQTKAATVNITNLIEHIGTNLTMVEEAVEVVMESNKVNTENSRVVTENFAGITDSTDSAGKQAGEMLEIVSNLEAANKDIIENIQTITEITEEVSGHANETCGDCEENSELAEAIIRIVADLSAKAQILQNTNSGKM